MLFLCLFLCVAQCVAQNAPLWQQEVETLDAHIEELIEEKEGAESRAIRHEDEAMRWQFQERRFTDAREAWRQADIERKKEQEIQEEIDLLKKKREALLKEHG